MFNKKRLAISIAGALALGLSSQTSLIAQESEADTETVEKIQVTGSRIARAEASTPSPIVTVSQEEIQRFGTPDLGSMLAELPAIAAGSTLIGNNNSNANAGLSSPDLRSLGANRTLTLVNGKRHVAGTPFSSAIDTGTIPAAMIERIELITGGASAIYGSDAVSGVINIILKDDYEGTEIQMNGTRDMESIDYQTHGFSVLSGSTSDDGRGNVTFFAGYDRIKQVMRPQLQQAEANGTIANPDNTGEEDGIPDRLRVPFVGSEMINAFGVLNPFGGGPRITFNPDGSPRDQVSRDGTNSFAFGNFSERFDSVFFTDEYINYIPDQTTMTLASTFRYDITDDLRFYGDFKYVDKEIAQQFQPSFRFGNISINATDNPYLDEVTRQRLFDNGQTGNVQFSRFFDDIGNRSASNDRKLFRVVAGFDGMFELSDTLIDYDVFYTRGETSNIRRTLNDLIPTNFTAALDSVIDPATGEIACRSQVPSAQGEGYTDPAAVNGGNCAPFNPFGFGQASAAAVDFVSGDVQREDEITQEAYGASLSFDSAELFELPGGPIGFAFGYEFREETANTITDEFTQQGFFTSAPTPNSSGGYDVEEFFGEVRLPILADMTFAEELSIDAAYRSADYSHAGSADSWQVGFMWAPIESLRIRGTSGESVRAPNVNEAFSPQSPGFSNINDPCDRDNIDNDPDRTANCAALGIPLPFDANDNVSIQTLSGGNPDLFSETATSTTIGLVFEPSFVENLTVTLDHYDIEIEDAIQQVSAQDILDNCVDATGGPDAAFCSAIDRDPSTNDVVLVRSGFINSSAFTTKGIEAQVLYSTDLSNFDLPGEVRLRLQANQLLELNEFAFQERPDEINVEDGEVGDPELQWRTSIDYRIDDISFNWSSRFIDRSFTLDISPGGDIPEDTSPAFVPSIWTHDFSVRYDYTENVEVFFGIRNAFNKVPPSYSFNALYDLLGRRANATVTVRF
ncbi:TonB-dependent receptor domain-containing protein [Glaciecola sp. KUL10]|uniref:TonB-dependent receptor domain-containing protein n=1 Tax=Glaciecola sp. (strain KUL10) TaxID=2161813 RepID=UPI000D7855BA|nr:TonB-dependent receptor [Glaciecola sp. KUL10]GBL03974.1 TonB-dependent receptor [Glaciecola sp. KUL10]